MEVDTPERTADATMPSSSPSGSAPASGTETKTGENSQSQPEPQPKLQSQHHPELPDNRFELELEFVQALASPAYLHYLATTTNDDGESLLLDNDFQNFLKYLQRTWGSDPDYTKYITYPHSLYFLDLLIVNSSPSPSSGSTSTTTESSSSSFCRELRNIQFRNFCHQQQFYAWQNRFSTLYGTTGGGSGDGGDNNDGDENDVNEIAGAGTSGGGIEDDKPTKHDDEGDDDDDDEDIDDQSERNELDVAGEGNSNTITNSNSSNTNMDVDVDDDERKDAPS